MWDKILQYLLLSILFYFASLVERSITRINFSKEEKPTFKQLLFSYAIFVACSVWLYILFEANNKPD
jgi:hypothetical protein